MKIAFWILRILVTMIIVPIHFVITLLLMGLEIINHVITVVASIAGFFIILVALGMLITEGVSISNVGILVIGVLCFMVPSMVFAALELLQEMFDAIEDFVTGTSDIT